MIVCLDSLCLSEVVGREHALGAAQNGVLGRVVRMLFGWDLQHGWDRLHVGVDGVTDHLCDELVDQDDADVITSQEAPAQRGGGQRSNKHTQNSIHISINLTLRLTVGNVHVVK